jgi:uncharacterized protein YbgA (DUF1722 family)
MGMGTPRPPLRQVRPGNLIVRKTGEDVTADMRAWADGRMDKLATSDIDGFIFKKDSPTCGVFRVKVYDDNGVPSRTGQGIWAQSYTERFPLLPVEEEGRLNDPALRENFVMRVFTHARWRRVLAEDPTPAGVVAFHTAHKLALLAHDPETARRLGQLVADAGTRPFQELASEYVAGLMHALRKAPSRGRHVNAMQHLAGFVKDDLAPEDKRELEELLSSYRRGIVPLIVPFTLLRHLLRRHAESEWVHAQTYLDPYPADLMLRNVV